MPNTVDPQDDGLRALPERSAVPVGRNDSGPVETVSAARRRSPGTSTQDGKSVVRASAGIYYARQNMLSQVGSVTTNGIQQKSDFRDTTFTGFADMPVWPNLLAPSAVPPGTFPLFTGIRVFDRDYQNPRIYSFNAGFERELAPSIAATSTSRSRRACT